MRRLTMDGEKDLNRLARQRNKDGRDGQHAKMMKDADRDILRREK